MRVTLVLPPLTQLNAPYPSISYLAGALRRRGVACEQRDLGIEWSMRVFSAEGLASIFDSLAERDDLPEPAWRALALRAAHERAIGPVIRFLQGKDRGLGPRILDTPFLPRGPRLSRANLDSFGPAAVDDAARHLATLYLFDLADLVTACVDEGFSLIRYQHHLAVGPASFDGLAERLERTTLLDTWLDELTDTIDADLVGLSVPFPGNLYAALRIGRRLRARGTTVVMGGGYVNTELRGMDEPRLWQFVDALTYDDGEGPLLALVEGGRRVRTRTAAGLEDAPDDTPAAFAADYAGLRLDPYLQLVDGPNPAHRLWSDGRWNKVTVAHGCYWKKCSFCDIQLDYIAGYVPTRTTALVDAMADAVRTTGQSGFHLVDEAAPPKGLRDLALELLGRDLTVSFWGNIRFESAFTPDLCRLLAAAGMIGATGGLEVASDRLLARMEKGVSIEQVARAAQAFTAAGILVHAYLMYGFPTETEEETVDSLEIVRQLFAAGVVRSAFWHRFVLTAHSGIARAPAEYGVIVPALAPGLFAVNDVPHLDPAGADHDRFDDALPRALAAWMRGDALDRPAHTWIDGASPTREDPDRVKRALAAPSPAAADGRLVWLGGEVLEDDGALLLHGREAAARVRGREPELAWLAEVLDAATPGRPALRFSAAKAAFPGEWDRFGPAWGRARRAGLVLV